MRRMHLATAVVAVMLLPWAGKAQRSDANSPATISIEEYVQQNTLNNIAAKQFVVLRCSGLYLFFAGVTQANGDRQKAKLFSDQAVVFVGIAQQLEIKKESTFPLDQMRLMGEMCDERAKVAKARTGNWSDDKIIASDAAYCKRMTQ